MANEVFVNQKKDMVVFPRKEEALINNSFLKQLSEDISVFTISEAGTQQASAFMIGWPPSA